MTARTTQDAEPLDAWIERQYRHSAAQMLRSVSPVGITKLRPPFDQRVHPVRGSIVASPVLGAYDPEPDYFFHWYRDSAIVIDALRILDGPPLNLDMRPALADFVHFSLRLARLDGRDPRILPDAGRVAQTHRRFVRPAGELALVHGDAVALETRVNPDGTLDILHWPRPQYDGPALRALALLRWRQRDAGRPAAELAPPLSASIDSLIRSDLLLLERWAGRPCFDLWEEENAVHYYTLRVTAAALEKGAAWLSPCSELVQATDARSEARSLLRRLDDFWDAGRQFYRSRLGGVGGDPRKELDIAVILGAIHAGGIEGAHSVADPRLHSTLGALERLFGGLYAINRDRPADRAPAMGRYEGDRYMSGGAYYFSTLGAAEYCFRAALAQDSAAWIARGERFLRTVRDFTPASGDLAEQFDQGTGLPASARHLAWSYAAFISCIAARDAATRHMLLCDARTSSHSAPPRSHSEGPGGTEPDG